jgi:hypothetical protein
VDYRELLHALALLAAEDAVTVPGLAPTGSVPTWLVFDNGGRRSAEFSLRADLDRRWRQADGPVADAARQASTGLLADPASLRRVQDARGGLPPEQAAGAVAQELLHRVAELSTGAGDWRADDDPAPAAIADRVTDETVAAMRGGPASTDLVVPLERCGTSLSGPVEIGPGTELVPLTGRSVTRLIDGPTAMLSGPPVSEALDWDLAVVVKADLAGFGPPQSAYDRADDVIVAVRLLRHSAVSARHYLTRPHALNMTVRNSGLHTGGVTYGPSLNVREEDVPALRQSMQQPLSSKHGRLALAARRLLSADTRRDHGDRLVDYWIGLEALYAPDGTAELSYRASLRLASALQDNAVGRADAFAAARKSYALRSKLVHGDPKGSDKAGVEENLRAEEWLRTSIVRWWQTAAGPDAPQLDAPVLSAD